MPQAPASLPCFQLFRGKAQRAQTADAGPGKGMARLTFRLRMSPGGPMGPMLNAMIKPAMVVAAEDLANRIIEHVEQKHDAWRPMRSTSPMVQYNPFAPEIIGGNPHPVYKQLRDEAPAWTSTPFFARLAACAEHAA
jgi:hypothetical protein